MFGVVVMAKPDLIFGSNFKKNSDSDDLINYPHYYIGLMCAVGGSFA